MAVDESFEVAKMPLFMGLHFVHGVNCFIDAVYARGGRVGCFHDAVSSTCAKAAESESRVVVTVPGHGSRVARGKSAAYLTCRAAGRSWHRLID
jgi:hypothetical protein